MFYHSKKLMPIILIVIVITIVCIYFPKRSFFHQKLIISYWANYTNEQVNYPIPHSLSKEGQFLNNPDMQAKLNFLHVLNYAFFHVDKKGGLHFHDSYVDLAQSDYAFCTMHRNICLDSNNQYHPQLGNFSAFAHLQNDAKNLKKLISIAGADDKNSFNNAILHIPTFVNSVSLVVSYYHLDGIDLDFELNTFTPQQAKGYAELVTALRKKLDAKALIVVTMGSEVIRINKNNLKIIAKDASFIALMCYSFHTPSYSPYYTGYSSNLYVDPNAPRISGYNRISCNQLIKYLLALGVPSRKIILGYPSYAVAYGGVQNKNNGLFQPFNPHKTPVFDLKVKDPGTAPYRIISKLIASGFSEHFSYHNGRINGVWAYNPQTQQFLSYDNQQLVREKAEYVNKNNLGGLMTWLVENDVPVTSEESLLKAANSVS